MHMCCAQYADVCSYVPSHHEMNFNFLFYFSTMNYNTERTTS